MLAEEEVKYEEEKQRFAQFVSQRGGRFITASTRERQLGSINKFRYFFSGENIACTRTIASATYEEHRAQMLEFDPSGASRVARENFGNPVWFYHVEIIPD